MIGSMNPVILLIILFLLIAGFWEIILCEGTHLGSGVVVWLYNISARRYDRIKKFDAAWERRLLGDAIANAMGTIPDAALLDVGAGTGRTARAVFPRDQFADRFYCLEPAAQMLAIGASETRRLPVQWVRGMSVPLPFPKNCFDLVTCLEMLEFTPSPVRTVQELVRVLRPDGWLLITNRVSKDSSLIIGKTIRREKFPAFLESFQLDSVETYPWQYDYDLVWAHKPALS